MSYYLIEQNIEKDDIHISWEYDGSIENIIKGKGSKLKKIYFQGKNETDFFNKNVVSEKVKNFLSNLDIDYISFLPYTFYNLHDYEVLNTEKKLDAFIMDVENELDCVDYEESDLVIFGGGIRGVKKLIFKNNLNTTKPLIFKIKGLIGFVCVNEEMKKEMLGFDLKGFRFLPTEDYRF